MEALEIELSYLPKLIDEDVELILFQQCNWGHLSECARLFNLDISHIKAPMDCVASTIEHKADQYLSEAQAEGFKAAWQQLTRMQQMHIAMTVWHHR